MAIGEFITTTEAAGILKVSAGRVRQFVVEGRLQAQKIGTVLFFKRKEVRDFARVHRPWGKPRQQPEKNRRAPVDKT